MALKKFTAGNYMKEMGLPHFDILLLISSTRFTSNDDNLINAVKKQTQVPIFVIRSKFDSDLDNEIRDQGKNIDLMSDWMNQIDLKWKNVVMKT